MRTPDRTRAARALVIAVIAVIAGAGACGGGQTRGTPFDAGWTEDHGAGMAAFERSFRGARVARGADVVVGVAGAETLVGVPLHGGAPWTYTHALQGRPAIAGSVVVAVGAGELFALDAKTGALLWSRAAGGRLRGAGDDGRTTVVALAPTMRAGSVVLAVARDGSVVRQMEDEGAIGVPAVAGDYVFFPWKSRFLSVYDLYAGEERARVALSHETTRVIAVGGALFAGERAFTRFDERIAEGRGASTVTLPPPLGGLPRDPAWTRPGTDAEDREASARDEIRLYARPIVHGPAGIARGHFAATYHRIAIGLDASSGALAWARAHDADFLGGAAYEGGFALCDAKGNVTFLDAETGGVAAFVSLGRAIDACVVQADAITTPRAASPGSLEDQVAKTLQIQAPELAPVQAILARELARIRAAASR
jgi:outer membrane protein assembly factor BamB